MSSLFGLNEMNKVICIHVNAYRGCSWTSVFMHDLNYNAFLPFHIANFLYFKVTMLSVSFIFHQFLLINNCSAVSALQCPVLKVRVHHITMKNSYDVKFDPQVSELVLTSSNITYFETLFENFWSCVKKGLHHKDFISKEWIFFFWYL